MNRPAACLVLLLSLPIVEACSTEPEPPGASGVPAAAPTPAANQVQAEFEGEVRSRFQRQELRFYLMLPNSFIGGKMPRDIARLLREVQEHVTKYIAHLQTSGGDQDLLNAHRALEAFTGKTAELYELIAAQPLDSVKDMREGLVISDPLVHDQYNRYVDEVNAAHERLDKLIRALPPEHQASFRRMQVATPVKK